MNHASKAPADGPRTSLVVDFKEFSAKTTLFAALSKAFPDRPLRRVEAVAAVAGFGPVLGDVAACSVDQLVEDGCEPEVVFGYCSAAGLALHIVAELESRGLRRPPVILVEPSWLTPELVRRDVDALSGAAEGTYQGSLELESIIAELRGPLERKLLSEGVEPADLELCVDIMSERQRAWFRFLAAAEQAQVPEHVLPASVILADDGLRFPHPAWSAASLRIEYLAGHSGELLGLPGTVEALEGLWHEALGTPASCSS